MLEEQRRQNDYLKKEIDQLKLNSINSVVTKQETNNLINELNATKSRFSSQEQKIDAQTKQISELAFEKFTLKKENDELKDKVQSLDQLNKNLQYLCSPSKNALTSTHLTEHF